jgi:hypothetical protein
MTIGTAIVIVMILYLLDKHGRLRWAAGIVAMLAIMGLPLDIRAAAISEVEIRTLCETPR